MAKIKKKLKKLKRKVKALQDLNTITELRLDKLESLLSDSIDHDHDCYSTGGSNCVSNLSEEELDEILDQHNREEMCDSLRSNECVQLNLFEDHSNFAITNELL
jgi:hypothetical protein